MPELNQTVAAVTQAIRDRSRTLRSDYLAAIADAKQEKPRRERLSCGNLAHGFAACSAPDKQQLKLMQSSNIAIVTAYNDMLSAHQPYQTYPDVIKAALRGMGSTGQVAAGVPAMCDGVTQGRPGMELSLLSRDLIAQCTAMGLSHEMFDGVLALGVCDKIVPGLLMGALSFGHLPAIFIPAGPMSSGLPNPQKQKIRQSYAKGEVTREALLEAESASYHSPGTCTFYGTANSNQVMLEAMGLQLPGSSFVSPDDALRTQLTQAASAQITKITALGNDYRPIGSIVDERAIVNGVVSLLASGGSTNHTIHLIAIARAAGLILTWDDFSMLSNTVPLLCRIYPNGPADVNHFQAAGGTGSLFSALLKAGLLHGNAQTVWGASLADYVMEPCLRDDQLRWQPSPEASLDLAVLTNCDLPFSAHGGLDLLTGNLGRSVIKTSAVPEENWLIEAPAVVVEDQDELEALFVGGALNRDCVVVVRGQGPKANGMPELHKLTPFLGALQDQGYRVALVTDGRMSGASGKVPAAIHLTPEALDGGLIGRLQTGDRLRLDARAGSLEVLMEIDELTGRPEWQPELRPNQSCGRFMFNFNRGKLSDAESGASYLFEAAQT
ncbi:MAG: phosphogluconate dehydratase [Gammaproteobacteria bacterium]|nr:phosphogluconate dehydratase [Gammaproteobacteria bacterium]